MQIVLVAFEGKDTFSEKLVEKEVAYMSDTIAASVEGEGHAATVEFGVSFVCMQWCSMPDRVRATSLCLLAESGGNANARVLLPGMTGPTLDKFIAYCEYHCKSTTEVNAVREEVSRAKKNLDHKAEAAASAGIQKIKERDKTWDTQYLQVPKTTLFDIVEVRARVFGHALGWVLAQRAPSSLLWWCTYAGGQLPVRQAVAGTQLPCSGQHDARFANVETYQKLFGHALVLPDACTPNAAGATHEEIMAIFDFTVRLAVDRENLHDQQCT